ncbi:hypothetical protein CPS_4317 [Colwellia psychrerythraea 34H]|uniref:Uncharacterized protein n=1 Tax=Colwellia psychrerythraea (strain 34H / ATCC BAA-681) TaxID=167879 RepID=Q47W55_COLP3|nr:hypothetical protein CPS_4317 [Colwellia psychrerythraea 34H]
MLVKILQGSVALNPNSLLLVNQAPTLELLFLRNQLTNLMELVLVVSINRECFS